MFTTFIAQIMRHKITNFLVYLTRKCQKTDMIDYNPQGLNYENMNQILFQWSIKQNLGPRHNLNNLLRQLGIRYAFVNFINLLEDKQVAIFMQSI